MSGEKEFDKNEAIDKLADKVKSQNKFVTEEEFNQDSVKAVGNQREAKIGGRNYGKTESISDKDYGPVADNHGVVDYGGVGGNGGPYIPKVFGSGRPSYGYDNCDAVEGAGFVPTEKMEEMKRKEEAFGNGPFPADTTFDPKTYPCRPEFGKKILIRYKNKPPVNMDLTQTLYTFEGGSTYAIKFCGADIYWHFDNAEERDQVYKYLLTGYVEDIKI